MGDLARMVTVKGALEQREEPSLWRNRERDADAEDNCVKQTGTLQYCF